MNKQNPGFGGEFDRQEIRRSSRECSADRIWKEALESCASWQEAIVLAILLAVFTTALVIGPA